MKAKEIRSQIEYLTTLGDRAQAIRDTAMGMASMDCRQEVADLAQIVANTAACTAKIAAWIEQREQLEQQAADEAERQARAAGRTWG